MKNKRIIIVIVTTLIIINLMGCSSKSVKDESNDKYSSMFVKVESTSLWDVVYHKETKVMYSVSRGSYNQGSFTLLVDSKGEPLLWEYN